MAWPETMICIVPDRGLVSGWGLSDFVHSWYRVEIFVNNGVL